MRGGFRAARSILGCADHPERSWQQQGPVPTRPGTRRERIQGREAPGGEPGWLPQVRGQRVNVEERGPGGCQPCAALVKPLRGMRQVCKVYDRCARCVQGVRQVCSVPRSSRGGPGPRDVPAVSPRCPPTASRGQQRPAAAGPRDPRGEGAPGHRILPFPSPCPFSIFPFTFSFPLPPLPFPFLWEKVLRGLPLTD